MTDVFKDNTKVANRINIREYNIVRLMNGRNIEFKIVFVVDQR